MAGGILRDICAGTGEPGVPGRRVYGSAALVGCIVYTLMTRNHILDNYAALSCVVLVVGAALRVAILQLAHEAAAC